MQVNTRRQARISALPHRTPPSDSDLTDREDAKGIMEAMLAATVAPTDGSCTNSDSELSALSDDDTDPSSAAEQQSGLEETEEVESEEDNNCEYSAYRGSDSEVSLNSSKKQSQSAKRHSKVVPRSAEGGNHKSPPQSETVNPPPALLSTL